MTGGGGRVTCTRSVTGVFRTGRIRTDICLVGSVGVTVRISFPPGKSVVSRDRLWP
jgi:hypothetical protein